VSGVGKNRQMRAQRRNQTPQEPNPFETNDPTGYFAASHIEDAPLEDEASESDVADGEQQVAVGPATPEVPAAPLAADGGEQSTGEDDAYAVLSQQMEALKAENAAAKARQDQERARAEAAEREARRLSEQVQSAGASGLQAQKQVIEHTFARRQAEATQAEGLYADALQRQDFAAAAKAQRLMAAAEADLQHLNREYVQLEQRIKAPPQPVYQAPPQPAYQPDPFEADIAALPVPLQTWARQHRDDLLVPGRGQIAVAAGQLAAARGLQPGSPEYLEFLDGNMGYGQQRQALPALQRQAPPRPGVQVSAPVSRQGGPAAGRRTVRLTQEEREHAASQGLSEAAYAAGLQAVDEGTVSMSWMQGRRRS
jgi:hypothetical protein